MFMDIYDIDIVNRLHYRLWCRHGRHWYTRGRKTLQRWRGRVTGWRQDRMAARRVREERRQAQEAARMEMEAIKQAQAKTVIAELDEPFLGALQEELYAKWHDQFVAKARAELEPEYEARYQRRCERWEDEHAGFKRTVQDEFDNQRERDRERDRRRIREEFTERFETATEAQAMAEQRLKETDEQLVMLIKALLPEGKKPFLHDCGIDTLDVWGLNRALQRHGLQIMHELTESQQRVVKVRTGEAAWGSATRFWTARYAAPEVVEPRDPKTGLLLKDLVKF
jgi:hypothetical protein